MDTEVDEPPDHSTKETAFEYFSRKMKIQMQTLLPDINDQVLDKHIFIKWKQVIREDRAQFEKVAAIEAVMCKEVKKEVKQKIEDVKVVTKEENKEEQEGLNKVNVEERDSDPTQNKTYGEESFENINTNFKPWRSWEDSQKSEEKYLPAAAEKYTPGTPTYTPAVEDTVVDTPAGVLSVESAPAVASTTPCTPAAAGRRGGRPAAAGSVYHTQAGVDTWCTPAVAHKMSLTPGRGKRGSPSKRRSLLLYHQRKVEEEGLGPSRLQLAATAWQMQLSGWGGFTATWGLLMVWLFRNN